MQSRAKFSITFSMLLLASLACSLPIRRVGHSTATPPVSITQQSELPATENVEPNSTIPPTDTPISQAGYEVISQVTYSVEYDIQFTNESAGTATLIELNVAFPTSLNPYQQVRTVVTNSPDYLMKEDDFGNDYAVFSITDLPGYGSKTLHMEFEILVRGIKYSLGVCEGEMIDDYLDSEPYIESDAVEIQQLSEELSAGKENPCQVVQAIYDWIGDNFTYSSYNPGEVGALKALKKGSGDCTEFSDLFVALSRAAGIPARVVDGFTCCTKGTYSPGDTKHSWVEVYLPGSGWVAMDPTWGRSISNRERHFAAMTDEHIWISRGRNLDFLGGYHFYYYRYWWQGDSASVSNEETLSITKVE